jgi:ATP-binding cassette subfamily B protein
MKANLKKMAGYYKPYIGIFLLDMFFAFLASIISLVIPLVVRYITTGVIAMQSDIAVNRILLIGFCLIVLVLVQFGANFFISDIGHVMGAKMEYDMRAEIFSHYQKLSFSFYDDQKVGQLMSRITSDLFDISELLHHGPENLAISFIKIIGAFIILLNLLK